MAQKILAVTFDGRLTYCTASVEQRGKGRCNHVAHLNPGESYEEFINKYIIEENNDSIENITQKFVIDNQLDFNKNPDWNEIITEEFILKNINTDTSEKLKGLNIDLSANCEIETVTNANGDLVEKLTLHFVQNGVEYTCDFGEIPHVNEDGTIQIMNTKYVVLPVVDRNKVGFNQGYDKNGKPTIWMLQKDGNLGITMPLEGDTVTILGKTYKKDYVEKCIIEGKCDDNSQLDSLIRSLDPTIKERFPQFGEDGWMSAMADNFKADDFNDLSYRRIHTYQDMITEELEMQLRRMGVTYRKSMAKDSNKPVFYQKNNTENIKENLLGRSNVQLADETNPIALFSQTHKITFVGREGYDRNNMPDKVRDVHDSFRGISDPLDQSSGKGIGLNLFVRNVKIENGHLASTGEQGLSTSDFVPFKMNDNPNRVSMACSQLRQAVRIEGGEDPYKLGDSSDDAWSKIKGAKIGTNLRTVLIPSANSWEDGCIISESAAAKMAHKKTYRFPYDDRMADKIGTEIKIGAAIAGVGVKNPGVLRTDGKYMYIDSTIPFKIGDKIAGRSGDKNVCGLILPDDKMPKIYDAVTNSYLPAERISSPLSIGKRGNIGIVKELNVTNGGTEMPIKLPNGHTIKANYGYEYTMRLNQLGSEKALYHDREANHQDEAVGNRISEMENLLLSTTDSRRKVLEQNKENDINPNRMRDFLRAIGVEEI